MDCFYTAKVFLLKLNIEHDALLNTVLVAFKQRRCFSLRGACLLGSIKVLVAFKQRRCFSERIGDERDPPRRVLVAFKQRRCFSQPADKDDAYFSGEPEDRQSRVLSRFQTASRLFLRNPFVGTAIGKRSRCWIAASNRCRSKRVSPFCHEGRIT